MSFLFGKKRIYADAAATTPCDCRVLCEMNKVSKNLWQNPSAIHEGGVRAKKALENVRSIVAKEVGVQAREVIFTGSGTEANNIAIGGYIKNLALSSANFSNIHIITSVIEHSSVLEIIKHFESMGVSVTYAPVSKEGIVDITFIEKNIKPNTVLVSVMLANNEIGTIQPVHRIGVLVRAERAKRDASGEKLPIVFHIDASQAPTYLSVNIDSLRADMMTLDGHKMYGPKGVGALIVRSWVQLSPVILGGGQERGLRSATEDVAKIIGFTEALVISQNEREKNSIRMQEIKKVFFDEIKKQIPTAIINGSTEYRLPNNINISIPNIDPEFVVLKLDLVGVSASTKSSCLRGEELSYVVKNLGGEEWRAKNTLRFSLLKTASVCDAKYIVKKLAEIVR